jgi:hypothetical protein
MTVGVLVPYTLIEQVSQQLFFNLILVFASGFLLIAIVVIGLSTRFDDEYLTKKITNLKAEEIFIANAINSEDDALIENQKITQ